MISFTSLIIQNGLLRYTYNLMESQVNLGSESSEHVSAFAQGLAKYLMPIRHDINLNTESLNKLKDDMNGIAKNVDENRDRLAASLERQEIHKKQQSSLEKAQKDLSAWQELLDTKMDSVQNKMTEFEQSTTDNTKRLEEISLVVKSLQTGQDKVEKTLVSIQETLKSIQQREDRTEEFLKKLQQREDRTEEILKKLQEREDRTEEILQKLQKGQEEIKMMIALEPQEIPIAARFSFIDDTLKEVTLELKDTKASVLRMDQKLNDIFKNW